MKLTVNYNADQKGFSLEMDMDANVENDAEALGYIALVLYESANVLAQYCDKANPKYRDRINAGIAKATTEKLRENPGVYPFTQFLVEDE